MASRPLRARLALAAVFFANGAGFASWVPHVPMVQAKLGLDPSVLGLALLSMAAGALAGIRISGWATARAGSRAVIRASAVVFFGALALPVVAPSLPALAAALALLGAGNGAIDVAMNAHAVAIEARWPGPIMSSFHAMWSAGGLVGAGLAAAALAYDATPLAHVATAILLFGGVAAVAVRELLPANADVDAGAPAFARPSGAALGLGAVAFLALLSEGAMGDWSAVYLQHTLGTSPATAALGFAAFSLAMAAGRFLGDAMVARIGDARLVRASTSAAALGLGGALAVGHPAAAIAGFAGVGFGIANLIPIAFRAAGTLPGLSPGQGIAAVGTAGYLGFLAGPPLIGLAARAVTLPGALVIVAAALAWIAASAGLVRRAT